MVELTHKQKEWLVDNNYIGSRTFDLLANGWKEYLMNFKWLLNETMVSKLEESINHYYNVNEMVFVGKDSELKLDLALTQEELQELLSVK